MPILWLYWLHMNANLPNLKFQISCWIQVANIWQRRILSQLNISYCENFVLSLKCLFYPRAPGTSQHETSVSGKIHHLEIQLSLDQILTSLFLKYSVTLSMMIPTAEGKWCHWTCPHAQSTPWFYEANNCISFSKVIKICSNFFH